MFALTSVTQLASKKLRSLFTGARMLMLGTAAAKRPAATRLVIAGLLGACAGLLCAAVWSKAATADHHCYTYGQRLLADASSDQGWCYPFRARATRETFLALAAATLLAAVGAWFLARRLTARDRRISVSTAATVALLATFTVVLLQPFEFRLIPVTPPIWLLVVLMATAYVLSMLAATEKTRRIAILSVVVLVVAAVVAMVPLSNAWQRSEDRSSFAELRVELLTPRLTGWHIDRVAFDPLSPRDRLNIRVVPDGQQGEPGGPSPATAPASASPPPSSGDVTGLPPSSASRLRWIDVHLSSDGFSRSGAIAKPTAQCENIDHVCWPQAVLRVDRTLVTLDAAGSSTDLATLLLAGDSLRVSKPSDLTKDVCSCP